MSGGGVGWGGDWLEEAVAYSLMYILYEPLGKWEKGKERKIACGGRAGERRARVIWTVG